MKKIFLSLFLLWSTLSFGADAVQMQKIFDGKKPLYEKLQNDFDAYADMNETAKQEYQKKINALLEVDFLIKQFKIDAKTTEETYKIFAPYINLHSYFVARYLSQENYVKASLILMSGVNKYVTSDAYLETFVFLLAHKGEYEKALDFYQIFMQKYNDNDVKTDYAIVTDLALLNAIRTNNIALLQKLYDFKVDFNHFAQNKDEMPPLFVALYDNKREQSARFLLAHGADKRGVYKDQTPLFEAVENKFTEEFVKYLISIGCERGYLHDGFISSVAHNPYMYAKVFRKELYSKELLLALRPDDYKDLKYAPYYLKNKLYDDLFDTIQNSNDIAFFEKKDKQNYLAEFLSVIPSDINELSDDLKKKRVEAMKLLITKGADLSRYSYETTFKSDNIFEKIAFNPVYDHPKDVVTLALTHGDPNQRYYIRGRDTNWTPLFGAISTKNLEALEILLNKGANINYKDEKGVDAFYLAVYSGQIDIAKKLISHGYKPDLNPKGIKHPLSIAVLNSDIAMLEYLQSLGYDIHKELFGKKNLLEFALDNPNKDIGREDMPLSINYAMYKYLITAFKDELNTPRELGYHDLVLSKGGKDSFEAFKLLLDMGVDVNQNNESYSPLQFLGNDEYLFQKIDLLLQYKTDINHQDKDGDTPLDQYVEWYAHEYNEIKNEKNHAKEKRYDDVESILLLAGAVKENIKQDSLIRLKQAIKQLIDHGAGKRIKNKQQQTPYESAMAKKVEDKELLELLNPNTVSRF
ncbi:MAG: ankyrin repeat domain-containing protein [Sulfurovaceae bacterium]|nr:ankyrin repeat domain-containing protein [Sulfurovaceae bacterium]